MLENLFILSVSLFVIIKSSTLATKYAAGIAESFRVSKYIVGFIVVAIISIFPETLISINSAIEGIPSFGLGVLFGSNVADLTLVFAIIVLVAGRGIKVESKVLKNNILFPFLLIIPIILGIDGFYTRIEGIVLVLIGIIFYALAFKNNLNSEEIIDPVDIKHRLKDVILLIFSMLVLLAGSHFTVTSATVLAKGLNVNPILIAMLVISIGSVIPELLFAVRSIKKNYDSLAIGDILGTVLADATIVVGILAIIKPFSFPPKIIWTTGIFMVISSFILFYFMKTDRKLSRKEGLFLFILWLFFVTIELLLNI